MDMVCLHHPRPSDSEPGDITLALLYERYAEPLRRYLAQIVRDRDVAEDLCQDTFVRALRGWHTRRSDGSPSGWLYRIARHTAFDYLRNRSTSQSEPLAHADQRSRTDPRLQAQDGVRDGWAALAQERPATRAILLLLGAGYRAPEIAAMTGRETKAVLMLISRSRRRLRAMLAHAEAR